MILKHDKRAVGTFSSRQEAEKALSELRDAKFAMDRVSIIAKDSDRISEMQVQGTNRLDGGVTAGVAVGGAVGELTGLLVGLGSLAIPGVGPIILLGATATAIATTLAGGAIGAATGGLVGGLIGLGISDEQAQVYHNSVLRGDYLVIVDGTEAEILQAEAILRSSKIREWEVYSPSSTAGYIDPIVRL
ncbi:general stress protein [Tumidithrix elongata RA019]|uniref:General stress protein n=1 Tax=Tumidithrix elongata BACA0141 TaxID=2716417 RepID=A0AAW9Q2D2_9CYAN|nr:general stress protein [Tumidithrix elongata RA019]